MLLVLMLRSIHILFLGKFLLLVVRRFLPLVIVRLKGAVFLQLREKIALFHRRGISLKPGLYLPHLESDPELGDIFIWKLRRNLRIQEFD